MKPIKQLFCKSALQMTPYSPIEPPDQIAKRLGLDEHKIVKLDANENPYGTAPEVLKVLSSVPYYHIYPDPAQVQLRESIAKYAGVDSEQVVVGTGADEIIDLICRLLLEPGEKVLGFVPTFSYYSHVVSLNRGVFQTIQREEDYSIDLEKVKQVSLEGCKIVMLCSPNNPSGNLLEPEVLDYLLEKDLIVMVDEAYYEFAQKSYKDKLKDHSNLVILRTFSKCFALAGLRVGYGITSIELASALMKIKPPFSVNIAAEAALKTCLENLSHYQNQVKAIIQTREETIAKLRDFKQLKVFPSQSNFILCRVLDYDASQLAKDLENKGILVRYFATSLLNNYIRISVGTDEQMEIFFEALREIIK